MLPEPGTDPSWLTSSTSPSLRDSLALSSLLFVCCWRQQSVQPQIHGSRTVVVGPVIGQGERAKARGPSRPPKSSTVSPSVDSSTLPRAALQKSRLALSAVTSLSFPSVPSGPAILPRGLLRSWRRGNCSIG